MWKGLWKRISIQLTEILMWYNIIYCDSLMLIIFFYLSIIDVIGTYEYLIFSS